MSRQGDGGPAPTSASGWGREALHLPAWLRLLVRDAPDLYHTVRPRYAVQWLKAGGMLILALVAMRSCYALPALTLAFLWSAVLTGWQGDPQSGYDSLRLDAALDGLLACLLLLVQWLPARIMVRSLPGGEGGMFKSLQDKLARQAMEVLTPDEVLRLAGTYLPDLVARWSKEDRVQLIRQLLEEHLPALIGDLSREEQNDLIRSLLPTLLEAFSLEGVDLLSLLG